MSDTAHTLTRLEAARAELTEATAAFDRASAAGRDCDDAVREVGEALAAARQQADTAAIPALVERKEALVLQLRELASSVSYSALRREHAKKERDAVGAAIAVQREVVRRLKLEPDFARRRLAEIEDERRRLEASLPGEDARVGEARQLLVALGGEA